MKSVVSGRSEAAAHVDWKGPGATSFAVEAESRVPCRYRSLRDVEEAFLPAGGSPGREDEGEGFSAVRTYFAAGGGSCLVAADSRWSDPEWAGDDAGPGYSSGVHAMAELDEAGTIVLPLGNGGESGRRLELVLELAERRSEKFFLLWGKSGALLSFLRPNVALWPAGAEAGALAAALEAHDFRMEAPFRRVEARPPVGLEPADWSRIQAWRRREGLRRSIDEGTRWVVFEPSGELLFRRVEREIGGFLQRLRVVGFFGRSAGEPPFVVTCGPHHASRVSVRVEVRIAGPQVS